MSKKITAIIADDVNIDLSALMLAASEFKVERLANGHGHHTPKTRVAGKSTQSVVMNHYNHAAEFTIDSAREWLKKEGFNPNSASPAVSVLTKYGYLAKIGQGRFAFKKPLKGLKAA